MRAQWLVAGLCIAVLSQCGAIRQYQAQQKADEHKQKVQDALASCRDLQADPRLDPIRGIVSIAGRPDLAMRSNPSFITEEQRPAVNALQSLVDQCRTILAKVDPKLAGYSQEVSLDDARLRLYNRQMTIGEYNQARLEVAIELTERAAGVPAKTAAASGPGRDPEPGPAPRGSGHGEKSGPAPVADGSGFVVSEDGHVLTNNHLAGNCSSVHVRLRDGTDQVVSVFAHDEINDLALLVLPTRPSSVASFRSGKAVRPGEPVVVVGFPLSQTLASGANVSTGSVAALAGIYDDSRFLQFSAPIQPGNSGGPVLDAGGNVIGIATATLDTVKTLRSTGGALPQNLNFAIKNAVSITFMEKNGVAYHNATSTGSYAPADIAERAKTFTVYVQCWN
jgi:S1-C subfamily serine protease